MQGRRSETRARRRNGALKGVGIRGAVKHVPGAETRQYPDASAEGTAAATMLPRKAAKARACPPVPQTDTGGRGEYPKVLE